MRLKNSFLLLFAVLFLSACGNSATPTPLPTQTSTPIPLPTITPQTLSECFAMNTVPTPSPDEESLFPPVGGTDRVLGADDAAVTFIKYSDFQCPGCAVLAPSLLALFEKFPEDVRVVYRDFPLLTNPGHELAGLAAQAVHAAALQDGDWVLQEIFFADQAAWGSLTEAEFVGWVADQASTLGMDGAQLTADLQSEALAKQVSQAFENGLEIGIPGTPFLLINGQIYSGPMDLASLRQIAQLIILGDRQYTTCPPTVIDLKKEYLAFLETEHGEVVIQFYTRQAPVAVNNFVFLAQEGWFDGITFHHVISGFMAQAGDPSGTGQGTPGYFFANEIDGTLKFDQPGVVGMANLGVDTNGSQFFITYAPAPSLDGKYTIFGQVISGMDVLTQLVPRDPQFGEILEPGDLLLSVRIEER